MAVVLASIPAGSKFQEISRCISWGFIMTGISSGSITRRFGYRLLSNLGPLTSEESTTPKEGQLFQIDFLHEIRKALVTPPPRTDFSYFGQSIPIPSAQIEVQIEYWEIEHNSETCETTETGRQKSNLVKVLNTAANWYNLIDESYSNLLMSYKPSTMYVCRDNRDLMYVYSDGNNYEVSGSVYNSRNQLIGDMGPQYVPVNEVRAVAVGPGHGIISSEAAYIKMSFGKFTWTYSLICCDNMVDIYFMSSSGGYNCLSAEIINEGVTDSYSFVNQYVDRCKNFSGKGYYETERKIIEKEARETIELMLHFDNNTDRDRFFSKEIKASTRCFINHKYEGGNVLLELAVKKGNTKTHYPNDFFGMRILGTALSVINLPS